MDLKEDIRARLNIEDVVGEYVTLKRVGRNYRGLSPFSGEKTPSFYVSPDKQIWHDFSGGKGGDVFSFVMEVEGLDFRACLDLLARKAGIDTSLYKTTGDASLAQKKQRLLAILDLAANYYQQTLIKNKLALNYVIKQRRFNKQAIEQFRIGYAANAQDGLLKALLKRGYKLSELKDSGLIVERRGTSQDMFRGRMTIPLSDALGQVVGFTARLIENIDGAPKYINTPSTLLYDKGRQLFGLHHAKEAIRKADKAIIVEGNLDVISSHQYNVKNVVAAAGTALTEFHLKSLSRLTHNVALAFDADKAGVAATERAIDIAQAQNILLTVVVLPSDVKDPDELILQDVTKWQAATDNSQPVVDWIISYYRSLYDVTKLEGKRQLTTRALTVIRKLQDPVEREHYLQLLAEATGASVNALNEKMLIQSRETKPARQLKNIQKPKSAGKKSKDDKLPGRVTGNCD